VLALLRPGDELVFLGPLYGGTEGLLRSLGERWGLRVTDGTASGLAAALGPATRMVWVEPLTNPSLRMHDLAQVAATARAHGAITVADNTFCTPCLTRPLAHGIDLVVHSMTKYLGGHGDATGGLVAGRAEQVVHAVQDRRGGLRYGENRDHGLPGCGHGRSVRFAAEMTGGYGCRAGYRNAYQANRRLPCPHRLKSCWTRPP